MISPAVEEIVSTVVNQVISLLIVLKRRSPEEVEVEEPATSAGRTAINLGIVLLNLPVEGGTASIAGNLVICLRTVHRKGNRGEVVEEGLVMGVERKVTSLGTVLRRLVGVVVAVALTVGKTVISYVFFTFLST
jgi:hypothetical protein